MSNNSSSPALWQVSQSGQIALTAIFAVILLIGIVGNLLVIAVIVLVKMMRSAVNLCLASLALADLIVLVFLPTIPLLSLHQLDASSLGKYFCVFVMSIDRGALLCSALIFMLIAVERYTVLCYPLKTLGMWTPGKVCLLLMLIWAISVGVSIPYGYYVSYRHFPVRNRTYCYIHWRQQPWIMSYDTILIAVAFFLPVPPLTFLYARMVITLNSQVPDSDTQGTGVREARRVRSQVVVMLIVVVVIFVVCNLPFKIQVLIYFYSYEAYVQLDGRISFIISWSFRLLLYVNHAVNPVVYFAMSANFREGFARLFCRCSADEDGSTQSGRDIHTLSSTL